MTCRLSSAHSSILACRSFGESEAYLDLALQAVLQREQFVSFLAIIDILNCVSNEAPRDFWQVTTREVLN